MAIDPYGGGVTFSRLTHPGQVLSWYRAGAPAEHRPAIRNELLVDELLTSEPKHATGGSGDALRQQRDA
jgi:hypothetical protein